MGSQEEFVTALTAALQNETVIKCLKEGICSDLHSEITSLSNLVGHLRKELAAKDNKITELQNKINHLEEKTDMQEQYSRRNSLRLSGIPENDFEDTGEIVINVVNNIMKLDPPLQLEEIDRTHRIGLKSKATKERPRQVIVKFATYKTRQRVFKQKNNLKTFNSKEQPPIFVNEDLTKIRSLLLFEARKMKKHGTIKDCWSFDGNILVKNNGGKIIQITNESSLREI